jgi:TolA-binding protein
MGKEKAHVTPKNQSAMWNIATSKFYSDIMTKLTAFFGLDPESATEAEIDQALQNVKSIPEIEAAATLKAQADNEAKFAEISTRLNEMEGLIESLKGEKEAAEQTASEAAEKVTALETAQESKTAENADLSKKIATLAGEISSLKAGKPIDKNEGDGGEQFQGKVTKTGAVVIAASEMDDRYGFKAAK